MKSDGIHLIISIKILYHIIKETNTFLLYERVIYMLSVLIIILLSVVIIAPILIPIGITVLIVKLVKKSRSVKEISESDSESVPKPPKPKREPLSSSAIMLLIGTAFIVLSGMAFGVASWVKTTPLGRVGIMFIACAVSFGLSGFMRKAFKLNGTSVSFYSVGTILTSVTLITAGYYNIFGNWLAVDGAGAGILYAIACIITASLSMLAYNFYKHTAFSYVGISALFFVIPCIIYQFADTFRQAAVAFIIAQTIITAAIFLFRIHDKIPFGKQTTITGTAFSVIFAVISLSYTIRMTFNADIYSTGILALIIGQLVFYGIYFGDKTLIICESIVSTYAAVVISFMAESSSGDDIGMITFGFITVLVCLAHKFVPQLKNEFTEIYTITAAAAGSLISASAGNNDYFVYQMMPICIMAVISFSYVFSENKGTQTVSGIVSPMLLFYIAIEYRDFFCDISHIRNRDITTLVFSALSLIMTAVAAAFIYLPKYAFSFHAKHPLKSNMIIYSNIYIAAYCLFYVSEYSQFIVFPLIISIVHFFVSNKMKNNFASAGSVAAMIIMTHSLAEHTNHDIVIYTMSALFVILMILSRVFFRESFIIRNEEKLSFDTALTGGAVTIFLMMDGSKNHSFFTLLALAIYIACFIKKNTSKDNASLLLSVSAVLTAFAFINRPFLVSDSEIITDKITLAIIALTGTAYKFIWKNHPTASKCTSTFIYMLSFIGLIFDAVKFHTAGNTIFVLSITTGIMILSFMTKSKTWFTASSTALIFITVYSSRKYLMTMGWWVYLFLAGIILIGIASVNEYCKSKGISIKEQLALKFGDWSW